MSSTIQTQLDGDEPAEDNNAVTASDLATGPDVTIGDDGTPEACTCPWPSEVHRVDVLVGINEAGQKRRRVIDQCQDCGGEVR